MRVLLVEDDPELRRRLTERLVAAGIVADSAASAGDARDWPDIDMLGAVILDLGPGLTATCCATGAAPGGRCRS